jgi:hypothetical protein
VLAPLIVRRRTETPRRCRFQFDAFDEAVERKVEIEPRLLAVGDDIEVGVHLILDRDGDGVVDQLGAIRLAELRQMLAGEFEPTRERITANDSGAKRSFFHGRPEL